MTNQTKKTRTPRATWIGVITIDLFNIKCPVFADDASRVAVFNRKGIKTTPANEPIHGQVNWDKADDGGCIYSMVIDKEATIGVWAHEASHLVDYMFTQFGIPTGQKNTEVRAYLVGYIVDQIHEIMDRYLDKIERANEAEAARAAEAVPVPPL